MHGPISFLIRLAVRLHRLTLAACAALLVLSLVAQLAAILLRYGFRTGFLWLQDAALWSFSALAVLAIPVAIGLDAHIRVDLFRDRMGPVGRDRQERLTILVLLVPLFGALVWLILPQAMAAWRIGEASQQIGGLPGLWLVRFVPVLAFALALIQGAARLADLSAHGTRE